MLRVIIAIFRHLSDAQKAFEALQDRSVVDMPAFESVQYVPKNLKSDDLYRSFRLGTESTETINDSQHQIAALTLNMLKIKTNRAEAGSDYGSICNSQGSFVKKLPPEDLIVRGGSDPDFSSATGPADPFTMALDTHHTPDGMAVAVDVGSRNSCDNVPLDKLGLSQLSDPLPESYRHSDGGKAYGFVGPFQAVTT